MQTRIVFNTAVQRLKKADIPEPELEISLLLSHVLKIDRTAVLLAGDEVISSDQIALFEKNITRRLAREPLAYITGEKEFWSLPFKVSNDVLIPRPETEFLLEKVLSTVKSAMAGFGSEPRILDLGTGSGVIAIIMALELASAKVTATDCSFKALKVAGDNAKKHQVAERVTFINSDWIGGLAAGAEFDIVISNPPYIANEHLATSCNSKPGRLQPEVVNFEPMLALNGGEHGVVQINRIAAEAGNVLKPGGWFFMEIGADQKKEVLAIFQKTTAFDSLEIFNDYAGLPRVLQARKIE
jgi:release factor glutamine methyltransferase